MHSFREVLLNHALIRWSLAPLTLLELGMESSSGLLIQVDWLQVIFRMDPDNWDPLFPDRCHIVEHCTCNSDVTCPVWRHPQPPNT
ncbi:hypothetical protein AAFF_G00233800 [Aldrovandia affinis]|uniref:Uncharacterized protein n=1 Tax=Aldrovandia affinis TaxID=143900 RepID=A0AAD7W4D0_9TELE|nr:hypothetical protein AAFF_G00233800 [Aldrovandia affinis]